MARVVDVSISIHPAHAHVLHAADNELETDKVANRFMQGPRPISWWCMAQSRCWMQH